MKPPLFCINSLQNGGVRLKKDISAAIATLAAAAGTAFYPGRLACAFFAQTGSAAPIGIAFSAILFGLFCACVCKMARRAGAESLRSAYLSDPGLRGGAWLGGVHAAYMLIAGGWMLVLAGLTAARALPVQGAFWIGIAAAVLIAIALSAGMKRALPIAGGIALLAIFSYYIALACDEREVNFYRQYGTEAALDGAIPAAMLLASTYAAMNTLSAAVAAVRFSGNVRSIARYGCFCALGMAAINASAMAALSRGGTRILSQEAPFACLAARWGSAGYAITLTVMALCACMTLAVAVNALFGRGRKC